MTTVIFVPGTRPGRPLTTDEQLKIMTSVFGGAFAGTPEEAREFIAREVEVAGLDTMNLHIAFGNISFENVCRTAELFASEVMPAFAEGGARP